MKSYQFAGGKVVDLERIMRILDGKGTQKLHKSDIETEVGKCTMNSPYGETEYFRFRCCKNGNLHLEFKRMDLVDKINERCGNSKELPGRKEDPFQKPGQGWSDGIREEAAGKGAEDFFETPEHVAEIMCSIASVGNGSSVLEPSAGLGAIAKVAREHGADVECIEMNVQRVKSLSEDGFSVRSGDFLKYTPDRSFDAVLMNPPFSMQLAIPHILHAWEFLVPGGILVSVAPGNIGKPKSTWGSRFRDWISVSVDEVIPLEDGTFRESGTLVKTCLVVATKGE